MCAREIVSCVCACERAGCQVCVNEFISTQRRFLSAFSFRKRDGLGSESIPIALMLPLFNAMRFAILFWSLIFCCSFAFPLFRKCKRQRQSFPVQFYNSNFLQTFKESQRLIILRFMCLKYHIYSPIKLMQIVVILFCVETSFPHVQRSHSFFLLLLPNRCQMPTLTIFKSNKGK